MFRPDNSCCTLGHDKNWRDCPINKYRMETEDNRFGHLMLDLSMIFLRIQLKGEKPVSQADLQELLSKRSVIPEYLNYENFTVGFVYANAQNPNNHKWMFEYRKHQNIFWAQHHLGVHLHRVPITTTSWFDGIYHGRFLVQKQDVDTVTEGEPGIVTIHGVKKDLDATKGDFSKIIPNDVEKIRLRFNIREDYWYADLLKPGEVISELKPLKVRHITAEGLNFEGIADFSFEKPKVYYLAKTKEILDVKVMAETLFITGGSK